MKTKKPSRRVRFFISEAFAQLFADRLADDPPGLRSRLISEVLRDWDGKTRSYDIHWRGPIELRISLDPDVYAAMRQTEANGVSRHDWFMQAFARYLERRSHDDTSALDEGDDDELSPERLEYLHRKLLAMRSGLIERIRALVSQGGGYDGGDEVDLATSYQDMMDRYQMIDRARAQLREVEAAIERMVNGEYGYCEKTGDPIGWRRLKANPAARLSIHAQEHSERYARVGA